MTTPPARKKDTGEPGNKGEFGHTSKAGSGLDLTAQDQAAGAERVRNILESVYEDEVGHPRWSWEPMTAEMEQRCRRWLVERAQQYGPGSRWARQLEVVRRFVPSLGESGPEADEAWQRHCGDEMVAALTERSRVEVRVFFDELHRADDREFVEVASGAIGEDAAMQRFPRIAQVTGAKVDLAWLLARDRGVAAGHALDCPAVTVLYQRAWNRAARQSGHGGS